MTSRRCTATTKQIADQRPARRAPAAGRNRVLEAEVIELKKGTGEGVHWHLGMVRNDPLPLASEATTSPVTTTRSPPSGRAVAAGVRVSRSHKPAETISRSCRSRTVIRHTLDCCPPDAPMLSGGLVFCLAEDESRTAPQPAYSGARETQARRSSGIEQHCLLGWG